MSASLEFSNGAASRPARAIQVRFLEDASTSWLDSTNRTMSSPSPVPLPKALPSSTIILAIVFSIVGLLALGIATWRIQVWRQKTLMRKIPACQLAREGDSYWIDSEALLSEKEGECDPPKSTDFLQIPVQAPSDVRWVPQIRSISCPIPEHEPLSQTRAFDAVARPPSPPAYVTRSAAASPIPSLSTLKSSDQLPVSLAAPIAMDASIPPSMNTSYALSVSGYKPKRLSTPAHVTRGPHS
ncbi:hypothetical protein BJ138DRAFT_1114616 [Hygrophoropsis aurantiaca]|uniref:Uncharacterized protein n=1 Tax=Hygrophoropsis aurantiaca TaxID=72124 RepID=A0ACB8A9Y9_9AGAM|nr:hypothetical protein BJ138DRAFT_1114616 [Hygrophoropsis aurantiaca]